MIKGTVTKQRDRIIKSEVNYRSLTALNCSMIKLFDNDPIKFFEEFKLEKKRKDKKTTSLIIGDLVDFYILDCQGDEDVFDDTYDKKFALYDGIRGSGQVFTLCDLLYDLTLEYTENGRLTVTFDTIFIEAFSKIKEQGLYKNKDKDKVLEDFNANGLTYYKSLIDNTGKTVVDLSLIAKSKKVAKSLIEDPFHKDVFEENEHVEFFPKFPVQWLYVTKTSQELSCKSEIDAISINHLSKKIYIKDLKTNYDNENFEYSYLKYRYDLQAAFYYLAADFWRKEHDMEDYELVPMEFIVADTSVNNRRPIRYQTTEDDLKAGLYGFTLGGKRYKGIVEIIEEICWADQNNIWNISKELFDNQCSVKLGLKYEKVG